MFIRCLRKLATSQKESVRTALCLRGSRWDRSQVMSWWFIQKSPTCLCYTFPWIHPLGTPGTRVCQGMISSFQMSRDISVYQYNCSRSLLDSFSGNESRKKKTKWERMWNQGQVIPSRVCDGTDLTKPSGLPPPEEKWRAKEDWPLQHLRTNERNDSWCFSPGSLLTEMTRVYYNSDSNITYLAFVIF